MIPIDVTLLGIVTDVSDVHNCKTESPVIWYYRDVDDDDDDNVDEADSIAIPIEVVLAPNVITHGVVVHKLQHPEPSLLLHVTNNANNSNDSR